MGISTVAIISLPILILRMFCLLMKMFVLDRRRKDSYRNYANIISAAELTNADAIHPDMDHSPKMQNLLNYVKVWNKFIGPPVDAIRRMGDKSLARQTMKDAESQWHW